MRRRMNKMVAMMILIAMAMTLTEASRVGGTVRPVSNVQHVHRSYEVGQQVGFQCKEEDGSWGPGPICVESNKELTFVYGLDGTVTCGWSLESDKQYKHMSSLISREASWECRMKMMPEIEFYVPFFIPVWGVIERDHIHVDNHMNFVIHAWAGKILGVSAYPVRDQFQLASPGGKIVIHGPVKWFKGGTFDGFSSTNPRPELIHQHNATSVVVLVCIWSLISIVLSALFFTVIYRVFLKPRLVEQILKRKKD